MRVLTAAAVLLPTALVAGCADTGPTDVDDLCSAYKHFRSEYTRPHPFSNKGVFDSLKDLGDVASRYTGSDAVKAAGPRLKKMGESDQVNMLEVEMTTAPISAECHKP
ncbi:hypothetical protein BJ999_005205 [Actinomadura citrea]|uniref:Lipoprotein n=1 Tax=Actinomadura citrea TaxID=46158 RepID=A0A7Y9GEE1_9ACTN|nr:hypothetical protein [Actinomadura citrea]